MLVPYLVPHIEISPPDKHLSFPASLCLSSSIEEQELTNNFMTVGQIITNIAQEAHYRLLTMNGALTVCHYDSQDEKKPLVFMPLLPLPLLMLAQDWSQWSVPSSGQHTQGRDSVTKAETRLEGENDLSSINGLFFFCN